MKILLASDYVYPGGYYSICNGLTLYLTEMGHEVKVLGKGYDHQQHAFPFSVIPTHVEWLPSHIFQLDKELKPDWIVLMMDIPRQMAIMENIIMVHQKALSAKIAGIFPIESEPISRRWACNLNQYLSVRFTFTDFGVKACTEAGVQVNKLTVGLNSFWAEQRDRVVIFNKDDRMPSRFVLTVADNQPRKNLFASMQIMSKVHDAAYVLITNPVNPDGWDLEDLAIRLGLLKDKFFILDNRTVSTEYLASLYRRASALLLTSLSEGIGIPIYEAQVFGLPIIASNCCGIPEATVDRQFLIDIAHTTPYPWGNSTHYWVDIEDGIKKVKLAIDVPHIVRHIPDWNVAAGELIAVLEREVRNVEKTQPGT